MERYKDTDLREALRRRYADTPKLPADFMERMQQRMNASPDPSGGEYAAQTRRRWPWVAAVACLIIIIGIGGVMMPDESAQTEIVAMAETKPATEEMVMPTAEECTSNECPNSTGGDFSRVVAQQYHVSSEGAQRVSPLVEQESPRDSSMDGDANLHYCSDVKAEDTVAYQDPSRVDDFIAKLAEYNHVKEAELTCSAPLDSDVVSRVYVFPDKQEIDVFGRLLQVACWYSDETPGYLLNFSHRQFFFELKDMQRQLHFRWIAERVNGKILLYSTCSPVEVVVSSACYLEYRDELMHTRSINIKTRDI